MQSVSSRIWTRVVVSISYEDNHYTTGSEHIYNVLGGIDLENSSDVLNVVMIEIHLFEWGCLFILDYVFSLY